MKSLRFDQLSLDAITKIVDIELKGLFERVEAIGYKMVVDEDAKRFLATKGYDVQFGARPLKRAIQNYLEDGLSELIVSAGLQPGDTVNVSVDKEKDELSIPRANKSPFDKKPSKCQPIVAGIFFVFCLPNNAIKI